MLEGLLTGSPLLATLLMCPFGLRQGMQVEGGFQHPTPLQNLYTGLPVNSRAGASPPHRGVGCVGREELTDCASPLQKRVAKRQTSRVTMGTGAGLGFRA